MLKILVKIIFIAAFLFSPLVGAAILIDESDASHQSTVQSTTMTNKTFYRSSEEGFDSAGALKHRKKMGVSVTLAGATGLIGTNVDFNIFEDFAVSVGGGLSRGFGAYNINVKQTLGGVNFQPYMAFGYSRWFSNGGGPVDQTSPSFVGNKFLSASERQSGVFAENIVYPALGMQYLNLTGDYKGLGFFGEAIMLMDLNKLAVAPTIGVGSIYYF